LSWEDLIRRREGYEKLLDRVMSELPETIGKRGDRAIILNPILIHEARRTIITNFKDLAEKLNRDPRHLARFIFKESGKPGVL